MGIPLGDLWLRLWIRRHLTHVWDAGLPMRRCCPWRNDSTLRVGKVRVGAGTVPDLPNTADLFCTSVHIAPYTLEPMCK